MLKLSSLKIDPEFSAQILPLSFEELQQLEMNMIRDRKLTDPMEMQKLKPYHIENLYTTLSKTPCGSYVEGKKQELTEKQKQRFLSGTTIHEVHRLLGTAFQYAVEWGILVKSPVPVDSPKKSTQERTIWTVEEDAGGSGQHGGPNPASGGAPHAGGCAARGRDCGSDPGGF